MVKRTRREARGRFSSFAGGRKKREENKERILM
jgi:hypothetical protein